MTKKTKPKKSVGMCGRSCSDCQFFHKQCKGCKREHTTMKNKCLVYKCAKSKGGKICLKCPVTIPCCRIMKSVAKSYCLVVAIKREKGLL